MIPYKQLSLADIFSDCQEKFENDKPAFLSLLETHIDINEFIPISFRNHFYASTGRTRKYPLQAFLWALIIQRIFSIPTDQLLLTFLTYSKPLREFCGFSKVPDASKITRFKQDFLDDLQLVFDKLVDVTEPICQAIDSAKADMTIFDSSGIEAFVAESKANRELCYTMADEMALNVSDNPKVFQSYLDVQSRFPNYSVNNALLILKQMPQATQLGDLNYWKNQKNYIRKNELDNNVLILEPGDEYRREDGSVGTYINAKKVYDISQSKNSRHRETPLNDINSLIRAIANSSPVAFKSIAPEQMPQGYAVLYDKNSDRIYLRNGLDDGVKVFQLTTMEIAHAMMAKDNPDYDRNESHLTAYAASYMLCKQYGINTDDFTFEVSPESETNEPQDIKKELTKIKSIANDISNRMEPTLVKNRATKEKSYER